MSSADPLAVATDELLHALRLRFYAQRPADYHRDRHRLLHALTWPATWLDECGLTCSPQRYQTLIEQRLHAIAAHGDPTRYGAYFPAYLLKCLQDWFDRHGEDLYSELKHIRNALDQLLASARFAERVQRHAHQLDLLVSTHRLLDARRAHRPPAADDDQLTLF
jgi:hypothetical protein